MHLRIFVAGLLLFLAIPLQSADKEKPQSKKDAKDTAVKMERWTVVGTVRGRIQEIDDNKLKIIATDKVPEVIASRYGRNIQTREVHTELELTMIQGVKVRLPHKPELDAKGRPKPVKKDPNDPDRNLPGIKGDTKDLIVGQTITATMARSQEKQPRLSAVIILIEPD